MSINKDLIALVVFSAVTSFLVYAWLTTASGISGYGRYYLSASLSISAALVVIFLVRVARTHLNRRGDSTSRKEAIMTGQRQHYRLQFDAAQRPMFIQKADPDQTGVAFTCPVNDISETGICLDVVGVYAPGKTISGEIIFNSGRSAPINGVVVREASDRTSLKLHCTISPPLLMAEQRDLIASRKDRGPLPVVDQKLLKTGGARLPSHSPKGICRIKRR